MPQPTPARPRAASQPHTENPTNKPVEKFKGGPVQVSIWENQGAKGAFRAASFEIRYRDAQQKWQTGRSYTASALLHLEAAAREARARIEKWRQGNAAKTAPRH